MTRKEAIEILEHLKNACGEPKWVEALGMAISSLGEEVYDKDTVAWMFRELQLEIEELSYKQRPFTWDDTGEKGMMDIKPSIADVRSLIQQKIDALKGESEAEDGNNIT